MFSSNRLVAFFTIVACMAIDNLNTMERPTNSYELQENKEATHQLAALIHANLYKELIFADLHTLSEQIKKLLQEGAHINQPCPDQDEEKLTLLQRVVIANNMSLADLLIMHGANPHVTHWGNTLLHYITSRTSPDLVQYLIENGVSINALNASGESPLVIAARTGASAGTKSIELLMAHGARFNTDSKTMFQLLELYSSINPEFCTSLLHHMLNEITEDRQHCTSESLHAFFNSILRHCSSKHNTLKDTIYLGALSYCIIYNISSAHIIDITRSLLSLKTLTADTEMRQAVYKTLVVAKKRRVSSKAFNTILEYFLNNLLTKKNSQTWDTLNNIICLIHNDSLKENPDTINILATATTNLYFSLLRPLMHRREIKDKERWWTGMLPWKKTKESSIVVPGIPPEILYLIISYLTPALLYK